MLHLRHMESTLPLKPMADVTKNPKQGNQWAQSFQKIVTKNLGHKSNTRRWFHLQTTRFLGVKLRPTRNTVFARGFYKTLSCSRGISALIACHTLVKDTLHNFPVVKCCKKSPLETAVSSFTNTSTIQYYFNCLI